MSEWETDTDDAGRVQYYAFADIGLSLNYSGGLYDPHAQLKAYAYPDGSVMNHLDADDLRDLASMLERAADQLDSEVSDA